MESSEDRYVARLIGAVDVGLGVVASAYGSRGVIATHRRTGRYVMVVVDFHPGWGRLAWHWLSGGEIDVIAPVGEVETVVGAIHRALSGPRAEAGRPGIRRDLP